MSDRNESVLERNSGLPAGTRQRDIDGIVPALMRPQFGQRTDEADERERSDFDEREVQDQFDGGRLS